MSEELAAIATAIVIIPKRKNTERRRKRRTAWRGFGYVEKFRVISNNSTKVLKAFSLASRSLYDLAFTSHIIRASAILQ